MYKKIITVLILLAIAGPSVAGVDSHLAFTGHYKTHISLYDYENADVHFTLDEILKDKVVARSFPVGTVFKAKTTSYKPKRRLSRSEVLYLKIYQAVLPDESTVELHEPLKMKAVGYNTPLKYGVYSIIAGGGIALKIATNIWTIGLPVVRGATGLFYAYFDAKSTPKAKSSTKAAFKGFGKGLLTPIPQIIGKGYDLNAHEGSVVFIATSDHKDSHTDVYLSRPLN